MPTLHQVDMHNYFRRSARCTTVCKNDKTSAPTGTRTRVQALATPSDNHYTIGAVCSTMWEFKQFKYIELGDDGSLGDFVSVSLYRKDLRKNLRNKLDRIFEEDHTI